MRNILFFILLCFVMSSCLSIDKFITKNDIKVVDWYRHTMKKEFIVYLERDIEKDILAKFPSIRKRFAKHQFDLEIKFLITSTPQKDILWYDYEIHDYDSTLTVEDEAFCSDICFYFYSMIQPKFYPTLFFNKPKRSKNVYRKHKLPVRVAMMIEFNNGEMEVGYFAE